ncbi:SHOCT domain-containing protein [Lactococcus cremoris]|nr:SHOCT domain-containing protein [Lactococcus cremoris]
MEKFEESKNKNFVTSNISTADELKKFKELLDSGVISQEDFDTQKKKLLK